MKNTIEEFWSGYKAATYPLGMSPEQERQVRMAFMAGVGHMFRELGKLSEMTDEEGVKRLDDLHAEMGEIAHGIVEEVRSRAQRS